MTAWEGPIMVVLGQLACSLGKREKNGGSFQFWLGIRGNYVTTTGLGTRDEGGWVVDGWVWAWVRMMDGKGMMDREKACVCVCVCAWFLVLI